jgi:hypothetical protein
MNVVNAQLVPALKGLNVVDRRRAVALSAAREYGWV